MIIIIISDIALESLSVPQTAKADMPTNWKSWLENVLHSTGTLFFPNTAIFGMAHFEIMFQSNFAQLTICNYIVMALWLQPLKGPA